MMDQVKSSLWVSSTVYTSRKTLAIQALVHNVSFVGSIARLESYKMPVPNTALRISLLRVGS
jgi:hypothetical protein